MKTKAIITLDITNDDVIGKTDFTSSTRYGASNLKPWLDQNLYNRTFATLEQNFWVLDGQLQLPTEDNSASYISNEISDENGDMTTQYIEGTFDTDVGKQLVRGITIDFGTYYTGYIGGNMQIDKTAFGSRPKNLTVTAYNDNVAVKTVIKEVTTDDNMLYVDFDEDVEMNKIRIEANTTTAGNRRIRIQHIYFGEIKQFDEEILSGNIIKECNCVGDELPGGTLEFEVLSKNDEFNILNPKGIYKHLKKNLRITVSKQEGNEVTQEWKFLLSKWENENEVERFTAVDSIEALEEIEYNGMYTGSTELNTFANSILETAKRNNIKNIKWDISQKMAARMLTSCTGFENKMTLREALQHLALATCSLVCCDEGYTVTIKGQYEIEEDENIVATVKQEERSLNEDGIERIEDVNYVEIIPTGTTLGEDMELYNSEEQLDVGTYTINFENPSTVDSITSADGGVAKIKIKTAYSVTFDVITKGTFVATGEMINRTQGQTVRRGTQGNKNMQISGIDIISVTTASTNIAQQLLEYYQGKYKLKFEQINPDYYIGNKIICELPYSKILKGNVTKIDLDIMNGFIAQVEVEGVVEDEQTI